MHHLITYFAQSLTVPIPNPAANGAHIRTFINIFLGIAGAVALLVISIAAFRFTTSRGSPNTVAQARDSIIYAVVGLVVIMSAFVIVNFVVFKLR
ncbi:MAG TPA: pilin [Patescibacteria group bacterium]|nr:pilin [Patescibacteria group bacterium]